MLKKIYNLPFIGRFFHTLVFCLQQELSDCESVLDLGCGPSSPLQYCSNIRYSVGVEPFKPYLKRAKESNTHSRFICKKIENLDFSAKSFDAVIMIEVLEHLPEKAANNILFKAEKWAKKKVIVSSPNGFLSQKAIDGNQMQKHLSGWNFEKMKKLGFKVKGLAGLKVLRTEVQNETMGDDLTTSIKYKPKKVWFVIAGLSQILTFYFPFLAFELFSVKLIDEKK